MTLSIRTLGLCLISCLAVAVFAGCTNTPPEQNQVAISIRQGAAISIDNNQSVTISVAVSNDSGEGVAWTCSGGACTAGTNLSGLTTTSVKFTATTTGTATVTATANKDHGVTDSTTITVTAAPGITGATLPAATVGVAYNQSIVETGGAGKLTYTVSTGPLPPGLSINAGTGAITGTPTSGGTYPFAITVTDSGSPSLTATGQFSITVNVPPGALSITTTSLPAGVVGTAYSAMIAATGGTTPYTFSISGTGTPLPGGLSITTTNNQGVISGTPSATGTFSNIIVVVTDSQTPAAKSQMTYTLTITATPVIVTPGTGALPNATQGTAYSESITATGGVTPYTFSLDATSAQLPPGLTFSASTTGATISGTPTATGTTTGIIVDVKDSSTGAVAQQITYSLTVGLACGSGSESLLNGQYAMLLRGFDNGTATGESGPQPAFVGAAITLDGNGNVTGGLLDINVYSTHGISENSVTGTYQIGADQRGCMTLTTSAGTQNYRISVGSVSAGLASVIHVVDSDAAGPFTSGVMLLQDASAFSINNVTGNYVLSLSAPQGTPATDGGKFSVVGVINLSQSGGSGEISSGELDVNDEGQLDNSSATSWASATPLAVSSGGIYFINGFNGTVNVSFSTPLNGTPVQFRMYVVSANELLVLPEGDIATTGNMAVAGVALQQSSSSFSAGSLNGVSILHDSALQIGTPSTVGTLIAQLVNNGTGGLAMNGYANVAASVTPVSGTGTASVAANGRVTLGSSAGAFGTAPVFWLVNNNEGVLLGSTSAVESGFFEPQSATTVSVGTPYAFGSVDPEVAGTDQEVGTATFTGTNVSGTTDDNVGGTVSLNNVFGPFTYSVDGTGFGMIPSGCTIGGSGSGGCQAIFYVVSPTKAVVMHLLNSQGNLASSPNEIANQ